ncbi:MAG: TonB-dependent receptor [Cyclobacteriaceae bacterium]
MKKWVVGLCLMVTFGVAGQSIEGAVRDKTTGEELTGALVQVANSEIGTISDASGRFILDELDPGRYDLLISFVGYQTSQLSDVWVKSGKSTRLLIDLSVDPLKLDQVVITYRYPMVEPGKRTLNEEQINRFAASYYDPARLVTTSPDVAVTNDQNNQISVRGLSPNYNVWKLEGVEIVNPNHTSNAGTLSDQPAATGGGVNILSAQMLGTSTFHYGQMSNSISNGVAGVFDMYLKDGVQSDHQFTTQASLIGFDLSAEGPVGKSGASYLANYRYSFTGLLTGMGVDFGGERIGFQDLAFNVATPLGRSGRIKVFGVGGLSFNKFDHFDFDESEIAKHRNDIYYESGMGLVGISYENKGFQLSVVTSSVENSRQQIGYDSLNQLLFDQEVLRDQSILGSNLSYSKSLWKGSITLGANQNLYRFTSIDPKILVQYADEPQFLGQYYAEIEQYPTSNLKVVGGVTQSVTGGDRSLDPRLALNYFMGNQTLSISAGTYSQLLNPFSYYFASATPNSENYESRSEFPLLNSSRYILGYTWQKSPVRFDAEVFYYRLNDVKYWNVQEVITEGSTYGVSGTVTRNFSSDWYLLAGGAFYDAQLSATPNANPFDTRYNASLSGGKEFSREKKESKRVFSSNARVSLQGGMRYRDWYFIDSSTSIVELDQQYADYMRLDIRLQWTKYKTKMTRVWAIDIQNTTNRRNEGFIYYDSFVGERTMSYQLGLIPILTYRLEF